MTGQQSDQEFHTNFRRDEPMFIKALQGHSSKNLDMPVFFLKERSRLDAHRCCLNLGYSRYEDSIMLEAVLPGGFGTSKGRKAMYCSLVSPRDPTPDPKCKPYLHLKNHHDRLFVTDLEAAQNSLEFYQTANESVLCHDTVPSESLTKIIKIKDGSERFGKEESKEEESSPTKKSRYDHGQPRENSWH